MAAVEAPIGVFDSGVGGLTVLSALLQQFPDEHFVYLGDTARLPYGSKSAESVRRYSIQAAEILRTRGIKCLVVACNTASAVALDALREHFAPLPVLGVLEPGAIAACRASASGRIAVIATEGTVRGGAYQSAIARCRPDAQVNARACPLFVALAEEGWTDGAIVEAIAHRYLDGLFHGSAAPDTLVLGCTHFPVFRPVLEQLLGREVAIVDSARTTAEALQGLLARHGLAAPASAAAGPDARGAYRLLATDGAERFARVGSIFLGRPVAAGDVEIVDIVPSSAAAGYQRAESSSSAIPRSS